jgi:hypothetical protein
VALALLAGFWGLAGRPGMPGGDTHTEPPTTAPDRSAPAGDNPFLTTAGTLNEGACIDPTYSSARAFATGIRADLAAAVATLGKSAPLSATTIPPGQPREVEPQAGIDLTVRQVVTNSLSSDLTNTVVTVPGVEGVAGRRPSASDADYLSQERAWFEAHQKVVGEQAAAVGAAGCCGEQGGRAAAGRQPGDELRDYRLRVGAAADGRHGHSVLPDRLRSR